MNNPSAYRPANPLPIPSHYSPEKVGQVYRVPYQSLAEAAGEWAKQHNLRPAVQDRF